MYQFNARVLEWDMSHPDGENVVSKSGYMSTLQRLNYGGKIFVKYFPVSDHQCNAFEVVDAFFPCTPARRGSEPRKIRLVVLQLQCQHCRQFSYESGNDHLKVSMTRRAPNHQARIADLCKVWQNFHHLVYSLNDQVHTS